MFYKDDEVGFLFDSEPDIIRVVCEDDEPLWCQLMLYGNGKIVEAGPSDYHDAEDVPIDMEVLWATKRTPFNQIKSTYGACGNEVSSDYAYGKFCIIVRVGPVGNKSTA